MSSPLPRFHGLDTLRAAAIGLVMLYHFRIQGLLPPTLEPLAAMGWVGVDLFFVLSGFLIGSQLLQPCARGERPSLRGFYVRRGWRILPAFVVVLLLYACVPGWGEAPGPAAVWPYATFTWNFLLPGYPAQRAFSHVWSLCVEEHFYLLLPVLVLLLNGRVRARAVAGLVVLLVAGGVALRAFLLWHTVLPAGEGSGLMMMRFIYYPSYTRLDGLTMGVGLALVRTFRPAWWSRMRRHGPALALLGVATVALGLWLCAWDYPSAERPGSILFAFPCLAMGFALLTGAAVAERGPLCRRVPGAKTVAALAFALYLTHKAAAHATHLMLPRVTAEADWRSLVVYLTACGGVASALYLGVERPCLALRMRDEGKRRALALERERQLDPAI